MTMDMVSSLLWHVVTDLPSSFHLPALLGSSWKLIVWGDREVWCYLFSCDAYPIANTGTGPGVRESWVKWPEFRLTSPHCHHVIMAFPGGWRGWECGGGEISVSFVVNQPIFPACHFRQMVSRRIQKVCWSKERANPWQTLIKVSFSYLHIVGFMFLHFVPLGLSVEGSKVLFYILVMLSQTLLVPVSNDRA